MIISGDETEPLFSRSLSLYFFFIYFLSLFFGVFFWGGGVRTSLPPPSESASDLISELYHDPNNYYHSALFGPLLPKNINGL